MKSKIRTLLVCTLLVAFSVTGVYADCTSPKLVGVDNFGVQFTVPAGCTHMKVKLWGGGGASYPFSLPFYSGGGRGGGAGFVQAIRAVQPGQVFYWTASGSPNPPPGSGGGIARISSGSGFIPPGIGMLAAGSGGGGAGQYLAGKAGHGGGGAGFFGENGQAGLMGALLVGGGGGASPGGGGFGAPQPNGPGCSAGGSGGGPWTQNAPFAGPYAGKGGGGYYFGGNGASCGVIESDAAGGGGGGGSSYIFPGVFDPVSLKLKPGIQSTPGGFDDPDHAGFFGYGAPGGRIPAPGHAGGGGRVVIAWDQDLAFNESNPHEDGDNAALCELPLTESPAVYAWPNNGSPAECNEDSVTCRLSFETAFPTHAICRYVCTTSELPPDLKTHIFRVACS